jgi:mono/diheme cytochrome c family protein
MVSTIVVVAALSSGHKLGLALVGAAFIVFALVSSFVLPKLNPDFPGRGVGWYVTLSVVFFVAMVAAVIVFGREGKEVKAQTAASTTSTTPATSTAGGAATAPKGDPAAGKTVFADAGCKGCHTLKAAGATGTIGPNLDQLKPPFDRIVRQVTNGGKIMPKFGGQLTPTQIDDVAAFVFVSTH